VGASKFWVDCVVPVPLVDRRDFGICHVGILFN
jgi:hypothetical protein